VPGFVDVVAVHPGDVLELVEVLEPLQLGLGCRMAFSRSAIAAATFASSAGGAESSRRRGNAEHGGPFTQSVRSHRLAAHRPVTGFS
jgi:hypothetical protein